MGTLQLKTWLPLNHLAHVHIYHWGDSIGFAWGLLRCNPVGLMVRTWLDIRLRPHNQLGTCVFVSRVWFSSVKAYFGKMNRDVDNQHRMVWPWTKHFADVKQPANCVIWLPFLSLYVSRSLKSYKLLNQFTMHFFLFVKLKQNDQNKMNSLLEWYHKW